MNMPECEICRRKYFTQRNSGFVCNTCGAYYTVDEVQELVASQSITRKSPDDGVESFLEIAKHAYGRGSYYESEVYCNKALELDAKCYDALRLKAKAICLQCGMEDRLDESIKCFEKAFRVSPTECKEGLVAEAQRDVGVAIRNVSFEVGKKYSQSGSKADGRATLSLPFFLADCCARFKEAMGIDILDPDIRRNIADSMADSAYSAWNTITLPTYAKNNHRDKTAMDDFVMAGDIDVQIMERSLSVFSDHATMDIARHKYIILIQEALIDAHSLQKNSGKWVRAYSLSESDKANRRHAIESSKRAINDIDSSYAMNIQAPSVDIGQHVKKRGVIHRTVTWRLLIAILCFVRFLTLLSSSSETLPWIKFAWFAAGIVFAAWWYVAG